MTLTSALLAIAAALLGYIAIQWVVLFGIALSGVARQRPTRLAPRSPLDAVTVLVPVHEEGESVVDTVRTLIEQDYAGPLHVRLLFRDLADCSVAPLRRAFVPDQALAANPQVIWISARRSLTLVAAGRTEKHAKLNHGLADVSTPFVAFLDADHRAAPEWIKSSVSLLLDTAAAAGVQARKAALSTRRLTQVWDGALSHLGHELANRGSATNDLDVFFTGSTAVFRTAAVRLHGFADTVTEDTYLSFDLLLDGKRIVHCPEIGSYEETAPNLQSFSARRRRWSAGHTHAFLSHLGGLWRAPIPLTRKLHLALIGQFFLLPVFVATFFFVQGIYYFGQLTTQGQAAVLGTSAALSAVITALLSRNLSSKITDFLVIMFWVVPHVAISGALIYLIFDDELYYFLMEFPYQRTFWALQSGFIIAAVVMMLLAWIKLRALPLADLLAYLVTLPLVLFFEILTSLLGFSDWVTGRRMWTKVDRANEVAADLVPDEVRQQLRGGRRVTVRWRRLFWVPVGVLALAGVNEIASVDPCGRVSPLLWPPLLADPADEVRIDLRATKRIVDDQLAVDISARVLASPVLPLRMQLFWQGKRLHQRVLRDLDTAAARLRRVLPLGWRRHPLKVVVSGSGIQCVLEQSVTTNHIELDRKELRVNGEPFLIKGMVPTFSNPRTNLPLPQGLAQLKAIGANAVRLYHAPGPSFFRAAEAAQVLVIAQPLRSTWDNVTLSDSGDRRALIGRFDDLARITNGHPFALINNIGNEYEIRDRRTSTVDHISSLARQLSRRGDRVPTGYSTFATYVPYPVKILGINMLDTGATYWQQALDMVQGFGTPFYASELGGFVAFFEKPPTELRITRMREQWLTLLDRGAAGAVFFSTHDNWAQAVPPGMYNDPFRADLPDDERGYWTADNRPKPELEALIRLFSDVSVRAERRPVEADTEVVRLSVRNLRAYSLVGVRAVLSDGSTLIIAPRLAPGQAVDLKLPLSLLRRQQGYPAVRFSMHYTTHAGLAGRSVAQTIFADSSGQPVVLNDDFVTRSAGDGRLSGHLLSGSTLELVLPRGIKRVSVLDRELDDPPPLLSLPVTTPWVPVVAPRVLDASGRWIPFDEAVISTGVYRLRFSIAPRRSAQHLLILAGIGAWRLRIAPLGGSWHTVPAHPYREVILDLDRLGIGAGEVEVEIDRRNLEYLEERKAPHGEPITIQLSRPVLFSALDVTVEVSR